MGRQLDVGSEAARHVGSQPLNLDAEPPTGPLLEADVTLRTVRHAERGHRRSNLDGVCL